MTILTPRELHLFPLDAMMRLSVAAEWNQTEADWRRILNLSPGLCYGIEIGGQLASAATAYIRPDNSAWIGMVLTLPEFRGRRLARQLLQHLLDLLDQRDIQSIGLDATDMGKPLYTSMGFKDDCPIERWARPGQIVTPQPSTPISESPLLAALAREGTVFSSPNATLYLRRGRNANHLGPFTASDEAAAQDLLDQLPAHASLFWDLFPQHPYSASLATSLGLNPTRYLTRMFRGLALPPPTPQTLAIAGFEYG